jgi:hypothetical protein
MDSFCRGDGGRSVTYIQEDQIILGEALFFARRFDEALRESQKTLEMYPNSWAAHLK